MDQSGVKSSNRSPCSTCPRKDRGKFIVRTVPVTGNVRPECLEKLSRPFSPVGAIDSPPIVTLCELTIREFTSREESLRNKAKIICGENR